MIFEYNLCDYRFKKYIKTVLIILGSLFSLVDLMIGLGSITFFVDGKSNMGILLFFIALFIALIFILPCFIIILGFKNVRFQIYENKYVYINFRKKRFIIEREGTKLQKKILGRGCYYSIRKDNKTLLRMFSLPNDEKFENEIKTLGISVEM